MKSKFLLLAFASFLLTGCMASVTPIIQIPEHKKSTSFQIGQEQQASLGEPMIMEEDLYFFNGLTAASDYQQPGQMGVSYPVIKAGSMFKLYGTLSNGDKVYQDINGERAQIYTGERVNWDYCIAVNSEGAAYGATACHIEYVIKWPAPVQFLKEGRVIQKGSLKFELIYSGKSKDVIKVSYREFKDDLARPAFTQDLSYDLSESKSIAFKKMKVDVVEATNSYIKFIVHSSMN